MRFGTMGLYEAIKDGVEVARKADNIEVMKQLLDAQKEARDLFEENRRLKEHIRELEKRRDISANLRADGKRYWLRVEKGEDGPFCTTCWDVDGRLVRLTLTSDREDDGTLYGFCAYCASGARKGR
jgi:hypothetical protein